MKILIVMLKFLSFNLCSYGINLKTKYSIGELWPKPLYEEKRGDVFFIDPNNFEFLVLDNTCNILEKALVRYKRIIQLSINSLIQNIPKEFDESKVITEILINLTRPCEHYPHLNMDEWYDLEGAGRIIAHSIWGILRGLETYSQLVTPTGIGILQIPDIHIHDSPRFSHRGLMLDTARHYIQVNTILKILDGMAYNKLNVLHWHIVDDESFPYQSDKFPELSQKGAYMPLMIYTIENISTIIEYGKMRGIRILAEFSVPGHTRSWGNSHPEILSECGYKSVKVLGPVDPTSEIAYNYLRDLYSEVSKIFQDKFLHIGGNKIDCKCWESNKKISYYMANKALTCRHLENFYIERVTRLLTQNSRIGIAWQEAFNGNVFMPKDTIAQIWFGNWRNLIKEISSSGHRVILSECWYGFLNDDWKHDYNCDPHDFPGSEKITKFIIGGEACIWTEYIGDSNVLQTIFPRISAVAEKLWSQSNVNNITDAEQRLEEHTCRIIFRGIPAKPATSAGIC